jgi:carbamoyltransferase
MEFGPRALGCRSILGDARNPAMQSIMNLKIKYRESFRPFAPSVLREERRRLAAGPDHESLWGIDRLHVPRSDIPAVTHLDYSARVQTVHEKTNPRYYRLLKRFEAKTPIGASCGRRSTCS